MTAADIRARLSHALRLDLIGPESDEPQVTEVLGVPPSRWYLSGFLAPWAAPAHQKQDDDDQGELELGEAATGADEDDSSSEPPAARRGQFPSSLGVSVLVPANATELNITARWGDYEPREMGTKPDVEWQRHERSQTVRVTLIGDKAEPGVAPIPDSAGLEVVTSVRSIRRPEELPGLPAGTRAVSIFLVNRRTPVEGQENLKDTTFAFQASLSVESNAPFVPRPNSRGRHGGDPDDRIAELQYRDVMEFAVGHGVSARSVSLTCVETTWIPRGEVERVEPVAMPGVELGMEALATMPDAVATRTALSTLTASYRRWIDEQAPGAPSSGPQGEVAAGLLQRAKLAANRIDAGLQLLDDEHAFEAFRLANTAMAMAARQRRAQEQGVAPQSVKPPEWRPFQLAFILLNLRSFVSPTHSDRELVDLLFFPTGGGKD